MLNSTKDKKERIGRMLLMHANNREDIKEAYAGDIVALAGLKYSTTGETLCDSNNPIVLEKMEFPDPVIEVAIEPKTKADQEKMGMALVRLAQEDPSFRVSTDPESGQTILKGMGELHLEIKVDILRRTYKVDATVGAPQVAYRETLSKPITIKYTHKKQTGGSGQFARVKLEFAPLQPGEGFVFAGINYYDGQGFLVRRSLNLNSATELTGARVCVQSGSTSQANAADYFRSRGIENRPVVFETEEAARDAYGREDCDAFSAECHWPLFPRHSGRQYPLCLRRDRHRPENQSGDGKCLD